MLDRIERVVMDVREYAVLARELSLGLYQAVGILTRGGRTQVEAVLSAHDAQIQNELPGF